MYLRRNLERDDRVGVDEIRSVKWEVSIHYHQSSIINHHHQSLIIIDLPE